MSGDPPAPPAPGRFARAGPWAIVAASALLGLMLVADQANQLSATYDEVTYLQVGARWWRTGEQESITRMGSPLTFWKIQQAPTLALIDRFGDPRWIDDPVRHQAQLLPWIRIGGSWIWLTTLVLVAIWARSQHGDRAMVLAAVLFTFSPNVLAHGALATMEMPLIASASALLFAFSRFLATGDRRWFWASASLGGLAFSCKFTTIVIPPILALIWAVDLFLRRDRAGSSFREGWRIARTVGGGMVEFVAVLLAANLVLTGCATLPLSARSGSHPILDRRFSPGVARWVAAAIEQSYPQDWVGFATQVEHQKNGGPSYLFGERRCSGWWYYYPVTLAVKVPLAFGMLVVARLGLRSPGRDRRDWVIPAFIGLFLLVAVVGSKRNYGVRYLLPLAPAAIVWVAALAEEGRGLRWVRRAGVAGMALAVASIHPYELSYFNIAAGGAEGGRRILSDSNLDWGQGAKAVAQLQAEHPEFRDLTWYSFGDTDPAHYGVVGRRVLFDAHEPPADLPPELAADTTYLAVSASLQWGPWGPEGYFRALDRLTPVRFSADKSVAIYRTADLRAALTSRPVRRGRGPG